MHISQKYIQRENQVISTRWWSVKERITNETGQCIKLAFLVLNQPTMLSVQLV